MALLRWLKSLRNSLGQIGAIVGDGVELRDQQRAKEAAKRLCAISFTPDGSRPLLDKIAVGDFTADLADDLEKEMLNTAELVEESIYSLARYADQENNLLFDRRMLLLDVISESGGKPLIRYKIGGLISMIRNSSDKADIQAQANDVIGMIDRLNAKLGIIYDTIISDNVRKAPKTAKKRKK